MNKMTRNEAIALVGTAAVDKLDGENCDFTNRVTDDGTTEFAASVSATDTDGEDGKLFAYYYQDADRVQLVENLDELNWEISHYVFA